MGGFRFCCGQPWRHLVDVWSLRAPPLFQSCKKPSVSDVGVLQLQSETHWSLLELKMSEQQRDGEDFPEASGNCSLLNVNVSDYDDQLWETIFKKFSVNKNHLGGLIVTLCNGWQQ